MSTRRELALEWRDGSEETVKASENETVLEAAESAGAGLPFGCRTGACGTCVSRLVDGEVSHERPPRALKPRHLDAGYVLSCVAVPRADCRVEVGVDVRTDLMANPWK